VLTFAIGRLSAPLARLSSSDVMRDQREGLAMSALRPEADIWGGHQHVCFGAISGREQCDPGQSILVAPIAGRYDEAGDRDRVAIAGARWDL
jgi:hypothetical protein